MNYAMSLTFLVSEIILITIGYLIKYRKAYWLISGYNTMSADKKKNVDTEKLGRFMGNICFLVAAVVLIAFVFIYLKKTVVSIIIFFLLFPIIIYTLVNAQKFDRNSYKANGRMNAGSKIITGSVIALLTATFIGVAVLLYYSNKPSEYTLEDGVLKVSDMYGQNIDVDEISSLELKETLPKILYKSNGSAINDMYKGYFKLDGIEKAKLFVDASKPPFIYVESRSKIIIFNCSESSKTRELFEKLNFVKNVQQ